MGTARAITNEEEPPSDGLVMDEKSGLYLPENIRSDDPNPIGFGRTDTE